jgi:hypothetical protein
LGVEVAGASSHWEQPVLCLVLLLLRLALGAPSAEEQSLAQLLVS